MRLIPALWLALAVSPASAQLLGPKPSPVQYVRVITSASVPSVSAGERILLWADITPHPGVHVYAAGARDFTPVSVVMTPRQGLTTAKAQYPKAELAPSIGGDAPVPAYSKRFRITQPITLNGPLESGETVWLAGVVNYQACDDKVCYPPASVPAMWSVLVR